MSVKIKMIAGNRAMKKLKAIAEARVVREPSTRLRQKNVATL
jgi:hypothetical protein